MTYRQELVKAYQLMLRLKFLPQAKKFNLILVIHFQEIIYKQHLLI